MSLRQEYGGVVLEWGVVTDAGRRRPLNEDHYVASVPVFVVADGMGGRDAGEIASAATVAALGTLVERAVVSRKDVESVLDAAHDEVRRIETRPGRGAGTTATGVVVVPGKLGPRWLVVNVGDSRTYLHAQGRLERVTVDHSEVQELVDAGLITRAQARTHPRRHVITRAIGAPWAPRPDFWWLPVEAGDRVLVCSDGLTGEVDDDEIARVLGDEPDAQVAAATLVEAALRAGGRDNITVVVVDAVTVDGADGSHRDEDTRPRPAGARPEDVQ
ncbi:serine/threonine-protein phosphatase [Xylanimonas allomyrinae]|uniref:Serine/threonine-protein phosphatase n=1 Tax=Xylanimonas allomyrinae TaxID=2509459 RepID=A0A4P6EPK3_9MICO|nr:protein phosphatase 2C domain-containing protein [Xylanimonas allomyrinae]QAY64365.1 serine/threonine-protein phosphatase [Xylanimonas allomyrinae]